MFTDQEKAYLMTLLKNEANTIQEDIQGHAAHGIKELDIVTSIINKIDGGIAI